MFHQARLLTGVAGSLVLSVAFAVPPAHGQCADWKAGTLNPDCGYAFTSAVWDIDGAGSLPPVLVVGGLFDRAGGPGFEGQLAGNIAGLLPASSGGGWSTFASGVTPVGGIDIIGGVRATTVYNGELIAAGAFYLPGNPAQSGIARWNGSSWRTLGASIQGRACCVLVRNGELFVGGRFTRAGNETVSNVAAWNGTSWRGVGTGVTGRGNVVWALASYGADLIAAGSFDNAGGFAVGSIARWNGTRWSSMGTGVAPLDSIYSLCQYGPDLYAGGEFGRMNGASIDGVARWNGTTWSDVGGGVDGIIFAMHPHGGELVVGGALFGSQNGLTDVGGVLRWNGTRWARFNQAGSDLAGTVSMLNTWEGKLVAGGSFGGADGQEVLGLASWDGAAWSEIPGVVFDVNSSPNVRAMSPWNGKLVFSGQFHLRDSGSFDDIGSWNGSFAQFMPVIPDAPILAMITKPQGQFQPDQLVIGGSFTDLWFGDDPHNHVALLDWIADLDGRLARPMGAGLNDTVWTLGRFGTQIIAGGDFTASGGTAINRLAKFDGVNWVPFDGLGGFNGSVRTVKTYTQTFRNIMAVGGNFTTASGLAASRVAQYSYNTLTGQTSWSGLDPGLNNRVDTLERYNGTLYAGGLFTATSTGAPVLRVARYTGGTWQPVGEGFNGPVFSLFADGAYLYAGGRFTASGSTPLANIARWDGVSWTAVNGGANSAVNVITRFQNELSLGGAFTRVGPGSDGGAGQGAVESTFTARFSLDGVPWLAFQPASQTVCGGGSMSFQAVPAAGYEVTHAWRKDGVPVVPGTTPHGSRITISGHFLFISNARAGDAGVYECTISNECGSAVSVPATLRVCAPDVNCDDFLDFFDYSDFVEAFETGTPRRVADFNQDGFIDFFDFDDFVAAFESGC